MSETEYRVGKLTKVETDDIEAYARKYLIDAGIYDKDFSAIGQLPWEQESLFHYAGNLYVVEEESTDPDEDICNARREGNDIRFELKYYNGGTCFTEMLEKALDKLEESEK